MASSTAAAMQNNALGVTLAIGAPAADGSDVNVPIEVKVPFRSLQFLPGKVGVAADLVVYVSVFNDLGKNVVASSFPLTPAFKLGGGQPAVAARRDAVTDPIGMATNVVKF